MNALKNTQRAYLIDASIFIFRYYFSLPDYWQSEDGYSTFAVRGYVNWLAKFLANETPTYTAACFDESLGSCFRNDIFPDYKISRAPADDELIFQLEACKQMTELMGIATYASNTDEADDLLGTISARCSAKKIPYTILSRDKDLGQLIEKKYAELWDYPDGEKIDFNSIVEKFGVKPNQLADFLAIVGDTSDDIPGVPGIGPKTAAQLLNTFGCWSKIRNNPNAIVNTKIRSAKRLAEKIDEYKEQVDMALRLTTINRTADLGRRYKIARSKVNLSAVQEYAKYLGLNLNLEKTLGHIAG